MQADLNGGGSTGKIVSDTWPNSLGNELGRVTLYHIEGVSLELSGQGRGQPLVEWLGPAIRGLLLRQLKDRACMLDVNGQQEQGPYCDGCRLQTDCRYGGTWEGGGLGNAPAARSGFESSRPVWLSVYYPTPATRLDGRIVVPVAVHGIVKRGDEPEWLVESIESLPLGNLAGMNARWHIQPQVLIEPLDLDNLPSTSSNWGGCVPRVAVGLLSPLFLSGKNSSGKKQSVREPQLSDLVRASLRTIGSLLVGDPLAKKIDWRGLKESAEQARRIESHFEVFQQKRWSSRSDQRYMMSGCIGGGVYSNVPWSLLPWLELGGRVQVGTHRVAGAGRWRLILEP